MAPHVSEDFLRQNKVNYIVQIKNDYYDYIIQKREGVVPENEGGSEDKNPYPKDLDPDIPLNLVYDETWSDPANKNPWRVWKVMSGPESKIVFEETGSGQGSNLE